MDFADIGRLREKCGKQRLLQAAPPHPQIHPVCFTTENIIIPSNSNGRNTLRADAAEDGFDMDWSQVQPDNQETDFWIELLALVKVEGKNCISTLVHLLSKELQFPICLVFTMLARSRRFPEMDSLMHFAGTLLVALCSGRKEPGSDVPPQDGPLRGVPQCLETKTTPGQK